MLSSVFRKSLRDQRKALLGWSIGILLLVAMEVALWPSIRDMPDLKELLRGYPEAMQKLFDMENFGTAAGFLNAELFSSLLPILFIVFGIGRGARAAGEEEAGLLDPVLVTPLSTRRFLLEQAAGVLGGVAMLGAVLYAGVLAASTAAGMGIGAGDLAAATLATVLLGAEFGLLTLAVGMATGHRAAAIATTSAAAVAGYALFLAGELVAAVRPWQVLSPFHQALQGGPLGAGLRPSYAWLAVVAVASIAVALPVFDRRDIAAR